MIPDKLLHKLNINNWIYKQFKAKLPSFIKFSYKDEKEAASDCNSYYNYKTMSVAHIHYIDNGLIPSQEIGSFEYIENSIPKLALSLKLPFLLNDITTSTIMDDMSFSRSYNFLAEKLNQHLMEMACYWIIQNNSPNWLNVTFDKRPKSASLSLDNLLTTIKAVTYQAPHTLIVSALTFRKLAMSREHAEQFRTFRNDLKNTETDLIDWVETKRKLEQYLNVNIHIDYDALQDDELILIDDRYDNPITFDVYGLSESVLVESLDGLSPTSYITANFETGEIFFNSVIRTLPKINYDAITVFRLEK